MSCYALTLFVDLRKTKTMKNIFLILSFLFYVSSFSQATSLNKFAHDLKNAENKLWRDIYKNIRASAVLKYENNHLMIVSSINRNAKAFILLIDQFQTNPSAIDKLLFNDALNLYVKESQRSTFQETVNSGDGLGAITCCEFDWVLVKTHFEKQKGSFNCLLNALHQLAHITGLQSVNASQIALLRALGRKLGNQHTFQLKWS